MLILRTLIIVSTTFAINRFYVHQDATSISHNQVEVEESKLYAIESEMAFLALMMSQPELMHEGNRLVSKECFFSQINAYIFDCMKFVYREAERFGWPLNFDPFSMLSVAKQMGHNFEREFIQKTNGMEQLRWIESLKPSVNPLSFSQIVSTLLDRVIRVSVFRKAREAMVASADFARHPDGRVMARGMSETFTEISSRGLGKGDDRIMKIAAVE